MSAPPDVRQRLDGQGTRTNGQGCMAGSTTSDGSADALAPSPRLHLDLCDPFDRGVFGCFPTAPAFGIRTCQSDDALPAPKSRRPLFSRGQTTSAGPYDPRDSVASTPLAQAAETPSRSSAALARSASRSSSDLDDKPPPHAAAAEAAGCPRRRGADDLLWDGLEGRPHPQGPPAPTPLAIRRASFDCQSSTLTWPHLPSPAAPDWPQQSLLARSGELDTSGPTQASVRSNASLTVRQSASTTASAFVGSPLAANGAALVPRSRDDCLPLFSEHPGAASGVSADDLDLAEQFRRDVAACAAQLCVLKAWKCRVASGAADGASESGAAAADDSQIQVDGAPNEPETAGGTQEEVVVLADAVAAADDRGEKGLDAIIQEKLAATQTGQEWLAVLVDLIHQLPPETGSHGSPASGLDAGEPTRASGSPFALSSACAADLHAGSNAHSRAASMARGPKGPEARHSAATRWGARVDALPRHNVNRHQNKKWQRGAGPHGPSAGAWQPPPPPPLGNTPREMPVAEHMAAALAQQIRDLRSGGRVTAAPPGVASYRPGPAAYKTMAPQHPLPDARLRWGDPHGVGASHDRPDALHHAVGFSAPYSIPSAPPPLALRGRDPYAAYPDRAPLRSEIPQLVPAASYRHIPPPPPLGPYHPYSSQHSEPAASIHSLLMEDRAHRQGLSDGVNHVQPWTPQAVAPPAALPVNGFSAAENAAYVQGALDALSAQAGNDTHVGYPKALSAPDNRLPMLCDPLLNTAAMAPTADPFSQSAPPNEFAPYVAPGDVYGVPDLGYCRASMGALQPGAVSSRGPPPQMRGGGDRFSRLAAAQLAARDGAALPWELSAWRGAPPAAEFALSRELGAYKGHGAHPSRFEHYGWR